MRKITDINKIRELKDKFQHEYDSLLEQEGFYLATGIGPGQEQGGYTLEVRLTPKNLDLETVSEEVHEHIESEVLPANYCGTPVNVKYVVARPRR